MSNGRLIFVVMLLIQVGLLSGVVYGRMPEVTSAPDQDLLYCSPAPCVLPPTLATGAGYAAIDATIAANPVTSKNLLLGALGGSCGSIAFYASFDGGSTWENSACMGNIITNQRVYYPADQPMVAYDLNGNAYIAGEYIDSKGVGFGLVVVQKSTDGRNWSRRIPVFGDVYARFLYSHLATDSAPSSPHSGNVYVSTVFLGEPQQSKHQVFVSHSSDGGKSWKPVAVDLPVFYPGEDDFTRLAVGKDGSVYVTWENCTASGPHAGCKDGTAYMMLSKSTDGGDTWSAPAVMTDVTIAPTPCHCSIGVLPNTNPQIVVYNYPGIGVDNGDGPYSGTLYVAMYSWTGTFMQVQVIHSTDGGDTWSAPVPVTPPSDTHDQFFPALSVSSTGLVGVSWMDRRNDPANINYQAFAAISRDGGVTFQPNVPLTQQFSNPNVNGTFYMGDYTGATWAGPNFIATWMDGSNRVEM